MKIVRTKAKNPDLIKLVKQLDSYLKVTDGDEHDFYNQFNNIDVLQHVVIFYIGHVSVGCGAFKKISKDTVEIKRMFVTETNRNQGIAKKILEELEIWAREIGYKKCILETGTRQLQAIQLYAKCNYNRIPNYGQYKEMEHSICFEKFL